MAAQPDPFCPMTVLADRLRSGEVTPTEAVETYLDRSDTVDGEINAYVTVTDEAGREAAGAIVLGKTNVPEFGHKGVTQNEFTGGHRLADRP